MTRLYANVPPPRPAGHTIRRLLVETTDGTVLDVTPHLDDQATVSIETKRDPVRGHHLFEPVYTKADEVTVDVDVKVRMDSRNRPVGEPVTYNMIDQASAVVMRQTAPMEFSLDTPVTQRDNAAPAVDPDAVQIGVPDRQQPALAFVQRSRDTDAPGVWFLGNGKRDVPDGRLERAMLRALLTTALADLDDAEKPSITMRARDIAAGSLVTGALIQPGPPPTPGRIVDGYLARSRRKGM